jgi:signal transduction histidine kinase/ligand-binding sensor domain-containing protein
MLVQTHLMIMCGKMMRLKGRAAGMEHDGRTAEAREFNIRADEFLRRSRPLTTRPPLLLASLSLALLLAAILPLHGSGIAGDYLIDDWSTENGLPSSSVTALTQTPDGYLWIGTYNGLVRFDGVRFVTFDPANTPALAHARVRKLFLDTRGTLWVNTYDGSLTTFRQGTFTREWTGDGSTDGDALLVSSSSNRVTFMMHHGNLYRKPLAAPPGKGWESLEVPSRSISALCCEDQEGTLWYRGRDRRLWRLLTGRDHFEPVPDECGLTDPFIRCLITGPAGRIWVGTDREIALWTGTNFQTAMPTNTGAVGFLSVTQDRRVWAVSGEDVCQGADGRWRLAVDALRGTFTGTLSRMGAHEDHHGGVWLYDFGRGLFHVSADGQARRLNPEDGFHGDRIDCFLEDREGNWWVGLDPGGLVRVRERRFQTVVSGDGTLAMAARSVCEDPHGAVWIGTLGGGLERWQAGVSTNLTMPGGTARGFVFSVCPDAAGRLWVSAGNEDLFVYEHDEFTRVSPPVHGVKVLLADHAGRIWAGTKNGLFSADAQTRSDFKLCPGTDKREVRSLSEDKTGALWAGASDGNLFRIAQDRVTTFRPSDKQGAQMIWSLLADNDGTVWAGTFRGGLLRFRDGLFTRYGKEAGLPDDVICQILPDDEGNLWLGSQQGVIRVAKTALHDFASGGIKALPCTVYGRSDGLPSLECSSGYQPAAWRGADGRLWFATLKGVASIQPRDLRPNLLPPSVVIEEVLIDGKSQSPSLPAESEPAGTLHGAASPPDHGWGSAFPPAQPLQVPPGKRQFEFRFTGLSLVSPDGVQFRYQLEGVDADWVDAGTRRFAQYSFLRPGSYRFHVIACNSDRVWNDVGCSLPIDILPHFYETWWFRALAGLVAVGAIVATVRQTVARRLRRRLEHLERQQAVERERTRIAKDIHDDLGAGLTQIALLSELARGDPAAESDAHLGQISDAARELTRAMDEIVWAIDPQNDTLDALVTYVCKFAQEYLQVAGIRCRLDLPEQISPHPLRAEVRHHLFLAVKESLNNIVKHARATEVHVRLRLEDRDFTFFIEDNGQGFEPATPPRAAVGPRICSGHGLGNLDKRLTAIGGHCSIHSQPGQGTRVELAVTTLKS